MNKKDAIYAVMRRYADAWAANDGKAIVDCYHDDIVFYYFGRNPLAGTHRGKGACLAVLKQVRERTNRRLLEILDVSAGEKFGFEDESLSELIHWAHIIDGAFYESAAQCVELRSSALKLMQIIEGEKDEAFVEKIIRSLIEKSLDEVLESSEIQAKLEPILHQHQKTLELIKEKSIYSRGVVQFDLLGTGIDGYNKFIPYYFYPETTYNVSLSQSRFRTKISVGSNPWAPRPRSHNIAEICERYGGGGHAVVGAISLAPEETEKGRVFMREIIEELQFAD